MRKATKAVAAKQRKDHLNKWAQGRVATDKRVKYVHGDAKSNVGEYKT